MNLATSQERYLFVNFHGLRVTFPTTHILCRYLQRQKSSAGFPHILQQLTDVVPVVSSGVQEQWLTLDISNFFNSPIALSRAIPNTSGSAILVFAGTLLSLLQRLCSSNTLIVCFKFIFLFLSSLLSNLYP